MKNKNYTSIEEIETSLKLNPNWLLNEVWVRVKDTMEKPHWVSAYNFKLNQVYTGGILLSDLLA